MLAKPAVSPACVVFLPCDCAYHCQHGCKGAVILFMRWRDAVTFHERFVRYRGGLGNLVDIPSSCTLDWTGGTWSGRTGGPTRTGRSG